MYICVYLNININIDTHVLSLARNINIRILNKFTFEMFFFSLFYSTNGSFIYILFIYFTPYLSSTLCMFLLLNQRFPFFNDMKLMNCSAWSFTYFRTNVKKENHTNIYLTFIKKFHRSNRYSSKRHV